MTRLLLAGDIGGTSTRLRMSQTQDGKIQTLEESSYTNANYQSLSPIIQEFFLAVSQSMGSLPKPHKACFAVAGPIKNNTCNFSNLDWKLSGQSLAQDLDIPHVELINDFVAVGYGILALSHVEDSVDLCPLQVGEIVEDSPLAYIGAGTGLGKGFVVKHLDGFHIYPSEGGHADFPVRSLLEFEFLKYLQSRDKLDHVSAERGVSGIGIVNIYKFLRDNPKKCRYLRNYAHFGEATDVAAIVAAKEQGNKTGEDPAAAIANAAITKRDALSIKTMELFVSAYGAEAGNLALKVLPRRGLYIAGGIAPKILPLIQEKNRFLEAFRNKGRMRRLLEKVPVYIVKNAQVGLLGATRYAAIQMNMS